MNTDPLKGLNPEDAHLAQKLKAEAGQIKLDPLIESLLDNRLRELHTLKKGGNRFPLRRSLPTLGWIALAIALVMLTNIMIHSLLPNITTQPGNAPKLPIGPAATMKPAPVEPSTPKSDSNFPNEQSYSWRGTKLTLAEPLPESPLDAYVYQLKPDHHATIDEARVLAEKFGLGGEVYQSSGQEPGTPDYFFTDGKQSLSVSTDLFFIYTADMSKAYNYFTLASNPNAEKIIRDFMSTHGFDFPYKVETDELYGGYVVELLSPDGFPMRYEYYSSRPMLVTLDESGQVLRFEANLMDFESANDQKYSILSAKEAFQRILDQNQVNGMIESMHSTSKLANQWRRSYPENQTITIHGYVTAIPAWDSTKPPFIQVDAYTAIGNTSGMETLQPNTYIESSGQFIDENDIQKFNVESWKVSELTEDSFVGTIHNDGQNAIITTEVGNFILPDVPAKFPMPFESAFVVGVKIGNTIDWMLIDDRMVGGEGGGGGGGGGLGFYKLNLSGTPVLFPTPTPQPGVSSGESQYIVKAGDTLDAIAQEFGITVDELTKANNITDPSTIYIDQKLIIPNAVGQQLEGQRGLLSVTLYNKSDGSQRAEYTLYYIPEGASHSQAMRLEGENLQDLQAYQNRPVEIWGTVSDYDKQYGMPIVTVERFNIPFPDLQFKILRGTQRNIAIQGQPVTLFTSDDGQSYVQLTPAGDLDNFIIGKQGDEVIYETLAIPDEIYGGYQTIRTFSGAVANNGPSTELTVSADQPYVMDEPAPQETYIPPTATIDNVELIYYVTNQHWQVDHLDGGPQYIQPAWKFSGHYSNGDMFEILVQALKQEYLLPELAPYIQGG